VARKFPELTAGASTGEEPVINPAFQARSKQSSASSMMAVCDHPVISTSRWS
jgi:hypothetical protein